MKQNRTPVLALCGALLLAGTAPVQALSGDQEAACGSILCLVGGSGVSECTPYLNRYFAITAPNPAELFERRLDFLNQCPASDMSSDVRPMIARYGASCQPATLVDRLNAQIRACETRNPDDLETCRPSGDEWQVCASFYAHGYTIYEAPELHEACEMVRDTDGYLVERCAYAWTKAGAQAPDLDPADRGGVGQRSGVRPTQWDGRER